MGRYLFIILLVFGTSNAQASFDFAPIIASLQPAGAGATASFTVTNPGETKIPVQITLVARQPDVDGKEVYKETDAVSEMFRIFPGQVVLNAKETRTVRVTYVGNPKVKTELAFRIIAEELPVDVSDPKKVYKTAVAQVTIATKYIGSLYVTPPGAKPEVVVEAQPDVAVETKDAKGKVVKKAEPAKNIILTLTNKGSAHQVVQRPILKLQPLSGGEEIVLKAEELNALGNLNILAGQSRKVSMLWPKKLPVGPVKATLELPKQ